MRMIRCRLTSTTVYALDSTTIDLCFSVFSWAPFRSTKAAVKLHTLLDLRGNIPSFIFISDGKFHDVNVLDHLVPEPGAFYRLRAVGPQRRWQLLRYPREVELQSTSPLLARCRTLVAPAALSTPTSCEFVPWCFADAGCR